MEPVLSPLEPLDVAAARHDAIADALVLTAWTENHEAIHAFLVRATHDPGVAEDLLQEAFLRLTRETRAGKAPANPRAWLYRVAANLVCSRGRRLGSALRWLARAGRSEAHSVTTTAPEMGYLQREGYLELVGALDALGPDARTALLLSSEGFSGTEIAAAIGRSPTATRTLMSRARVLVRRRLDVTETVR